jgi:hypothetical protein
MFGYMRMQILAYKCRRQHHRNEHFLFKIVEPHAELDMLFFSRVGENILDKTEGKVNLMEHLQKKNIFLIILKKSVIW